MCVCVHARVCARVQCAASAAARTEKPFNTQKLERHIKPIINILPGKNTKSIFFSEKLITWKRGESGFDV